jgi:hypothetical protein
MSSEDSGVGESVGAGQLRQLYEWRLNPAGVNAIYPENRTFAIIGQY